MYKLKAQLLKLDRTIEYPGKQLKAQALAPHPTNPHQKKNRKFPKTRRKKTECIHVGITAQLTKFKHEQDSSTELNPETIPKKINKIVYTCWLSGAIGVTTYKKKIYKS